MKNFPAKVLGTVIASKELIARKERGATAVEYGIMVALIAAVIIVVVSTLGGKLSDLFSNVATQI
jgi:pilus assembly protein Flp/PilA